MPSAEQTQDIYSSYFESVEQSISQLSADGPLLVAGDFNAHLSSSQTGRPTPFKVY